MRKLTNEAQRFDPLVGASLFTFPLLANWVSLFATWCAIALIGLGYIHAGVRRD